MNSLPMLEGMPSLLSFSAAAYIARFWSRLRIGIGHRVLCADGSSQALDGALGSAGELCELPAATRVPGKGGLGGAGLLGELVAARGLEIGPIDLGGEQLGGKAG